MATGAITEKTDSRIVTLSDGPVADFQFSIDGLEMNATNMSVGATSYVWDFGDGKKSAAINPLHLYAEPGSYNIQLIALNPCGNDTLHKNLIITSLETSEAGFAFSLYPNPNEGVFEISLQGKRSVDIEIRIFDLLGRTIWSEAWANRQYLVETIDLNQDVIFPQGTYLYQVQYDGQLITGKIFIE